MKYWLRDSDKGFEIVDRAGQSVSFDEAHRVINSLLETYAFPAYVYIACKPTLPNMEYKIGYSAQNPEKRMSQLRYQEKDDRIFLLHTIACDSVSDAIRLETNLHGYFNRSHIRGEWFCLKRSDIQMLLESENEATLSFQIVYHWVLGLVHRAVKTNGKCFDGMTDEERVDLYSLFKELRSTFDEMAVKFEIEDLTPDESVMLEYSFIDSE